jgi:hypothetical protein
MVPVNKPVYVMDKRAAAFLGQGSCTDRLHPLSRCMLHVYWQPVAATTPYHLKRPKSETSKRYN